MTPPSLIPVLCCCLWAIQHVTSFSTVTSSIYKRSLISLIRKPIIGQLSATQSDEDLFQVFLRERERRSFMMEHEPFKEMDPYQQETFLQLMKKQDLEEGEVIFTGGCEATQVFVVADGTLEAFEEGGEKVLLNYTKGDLIGADSYATLTPYLYSVRSTSPNASVWVIDNKNIDTITSTTKGRKSQFQEKLESYLEANFSDFQNAYLEEIDRKEIISKAPIFRGILKEEINDVAVALKTLHLKKGDILIEEGSDFQETMYLVRNGELECYKGKDDGNNILCLYKRGGSFGELAVFYATPRQASIKVITDTAEVWEISRDELFDAVQESPLESIAKAALEKAYPGENAITPFNEIYENWVIKSRPKKKPVSFHSTVSIVAAGAYLAAYQPFFHLGLDKDGFLQFFDFSRPLTIDACHQIQLSVWLLAISGILGFFRIPPRAPPARRLPFTLATLANVFFALFLSSSLNALPDGYWYFDAFSVLGTTALAITFFIEEFCLLSAFDNAISGSEAGLTSTPGGCGRASNIFFASITYFVVNVAQVPLVIPIFFSDLASYQRSMSAAFEAVGFPAIDFHSIATAVGFVSFLQLLATLQFEKKISEIQGVIGLVTLFVVFNWDAILGDYKTVFRPDLLPIIENTNNYLPGIIEQNHLVELVVGITALVILNAIRKIAFTSE
eukprot:CAMPEP_0183713156 /NCGR_PEP_ID=MMETSP0737-20130205/8093_1 /TAXON_ID=385413 /ORGANISM="Thalassiosira miniscula, Strain CCMP1093" /LENGTH=674 /DNA_ID=CAMNT_0025941905 /DNA_START=296 /DNA_END=2320 /DNA_ORIENTATION=+